MRIFGVFVMLFATVLGWVIVNSLQTSRTVANWDAVECTILKSGVKRHAIDSFLFTATFEYEVAGRKLRSSDIGRPSEGCYCFRSISERLPLLERFAVGSRHACKVDPANPSCAVLVVDETSKTLGGILALAFVARPNEDRGLPVPNCHGMNEAMGGVVSAGNSSRARNLT